MKRKQFLVLAGALCTASILAFALQDVVRQAIILPLVYAWWVFELYYRSFPQIIIWAVVVIFVLFIFFSSLITERTPREYEEPHSQPAPGAVENLALTLEKSRRGIYAKWQIAHRLGKLAYNLLVQQDDRASAKITAPLTGRNWQPPEQVQDYLSAGLTGSFADYPQRRWPFQRPNPTPFDIDVREAVEFLESQMEKKRNNVWKIHPDH